MRKKLLAGNWKMNKLQGDLAGFFEVFAKELALKTNPKLLTKVDTLFAVPFTLLEKSQKIASELGIGIAAQNAHFEKNGAFTGEVSLAMLKDIGIFTSLIGHSERRQYFGETDATVALKAKACLAEGVTPIVCIGETKDERVSGQTKAVITRQIKAVFEALPDLKGLIFAYEPVWAIGTGLSATSAEAQEVHALIRSLIKESYGQGKASEVRILYGGSAKPSNIKELLGQPDIDGGLVGGASLDPVEFAKMVLAGV